MPSAETVRSWDAKAIVEEQLLEEELLEEVLLLEVVERL